MNKIVFFTCSLLSFFLVGCCKTHLVVLDHETYTGPKVNNLVIAVGDFKDSREQGSYCLGAIHNEKGKLLETLKTPKQVSDMVRDVFIEALKQRGIYSDSDNAQYILNVDVKRYYFSRETNGEAHIELDVKIQDHEKNQVVFSDHIVGDNFELTMAGTLPDSEEYLKKLAEKTLAQAIVDVFNNPELEKLYQPG